MVPISDSQAATARRQAPSVSNSRWLWLGSRNSESQSLPRLIPPGSASSAPPPLSKSNPSGGRRRRVETREIINRRWAAGAVPLCKSLSALLQSAVGVGPGHCTCVGACGGCGQLGGSPDRRATHGGGSVPLRKPQRKLPSPQTPDSPATLGFRNVRRNRKELAPEISGLEKQKDQLEAEPKKVLLSFLFFPRS